MLAGVNRKLIDGVEHIATSRERALESAAKLAEMVRHDPDEIPAAARDMAASVPSEVYTRAQALDFLFDSAPRLTKDERKALRKKADKAYTKGRRGPQRSYLWQPDAAFRRAELDSEKEKQRIRRDARRELDEEEGDGGAADEGPDYADIASILAGGTERRETDAGGVRNDGVRLGYRGKTHALIGPPERGKTLILVAMACDELNAGGRVLHIDTDDNGASDLTALYVAFGADPDTLADPQRFRLVIARSAEHVERIVAEAASWGPTFASLDAVAPSMALHGLNPDVNAEYRRWHGIVPKRLAEAGAAVFQNDHVNKVETPGGYATGAGQKLGALSGIQYGVSLVEPFVPGVGGAAALTILKDRPGALRAVSPSGKSPRAAVFSLDSRGGSSTWEFWKGRDDDDRADEQFEADVVHVLSLKPFPASRSKLQAALVASQGKGWGSDRARLALEEARKRHEAPNLFPIENKE
ncbi:putative Protein RecA [Microbacterium sp. C448]|uniref:hypothetical protein n=1 Tax=Microbacterium sp. C448 TaxID=1177594 RepID=UPI0003DE1886|nr:hypothetical protein [Microbacterium sp. C448]CDK00712.1 putative Protein RecA [Microbacterium sp. C448]